MEAKALVRKRVLLPALLVAVIVLGLFAALAFVLNGQLTAKDEQTLVVIQDYPHTLVVALATDLTTGQSGQTFMTATFNHIGAGSSDGALIIQINASGILLADVTIGGTMTPIPSDPPAAFVPEYNQLTDAIQVKCYWASGELNGVGKVARIWDVTIDLPYFINAAIGSWTITTWVQNEA